MDNKIIIYSQDSECGKSPTWLEKLFSIQNYMFCFQFQPENAKWILPRNPQSFRCRVAGNPGVFHTLDEKWAVSVLLKCAAQQTI